jgi:hypothetical protein
MLSQAEIAHFEGILETGFSCSSAFVVLTNYALQQAAFAAPLLRRSPFF